MAHDAQTVLAKWSRNTTAGIPSYKAGVMAVTQSPMEMAAQRADYYLQRIQDAVASGRYQAGLRSVTLADWQTAAADKGSARIAAGVTAAQPKVQSFLNQFLPFVANVRATVQRMPKGGAAEADQRMLAAVNMMRQFKFQRRQGG